MANARSAGLARHVGMLFELGTVGALTDGQLLERFTTRKGEAAEWAFAALVERHGPMVQRVCKAILRDAHDADDAFQATFLIVARRARSLQASNSLGAWLFGVARRVALRLRAREARHKRHEGEVAKGAAPHALDSTDDGSISAIHAEIAHLPRRFRDAVVLCLLEGLTHKEAARRLGCPVGTLESRLARGRRRLQLNLTRKGLAPAVGAAGACRFSAELAAASLPSRLVEATAQSAARLLAARSAPFVAVSSRVAALTQGGLKIMAVHPLKLGAARLLAAASLLVVPILASPSPGAGDAPPPALEPQLDRSEPTPTPFDAAAAVEAKDQATADDLLAWFPPRPWETVVRIKIRREGWIGFGSGAIVASTPSESIVLTAAHHFKLEPTDGGRAADRFPHRVTVELFDGKPEGSAVPGEAYEAQLIDRDSERDVALVRFHPGRRLPASPVAPATWEPRTGTRVFAIGCSEGRDPTLMSTTITNPRLRGLSGSAEYEAIECARAPLQGRAGGGLFTADGSLVGVCNFAEPRGDRGLYATTASIHRLLAKNGLERLVRDANDARTIDHRDRAGDDLAPAQRDSRVARRGSEEGVSDAERLWTLERRIDGIDAKLDEILEALKRAPR